MATASAAANAMFFLHNCISTILAMIVIVVILSDSGLGRVVYTLRPPCKPCSGHECDMRTSQVCQFGEHLDRCNRTLCSKGPGERCGERGNIFGVCSSEGLWCSSKDNRCHGCYIPTMLCYPED